jgi:hypothetical protein
LRSCHARTVPRQALNVDELFDSAVEAVGRQGSAARPDFDASLDAGHVAPPEPPLVPPVTMLVPPLAVPPGVPIDPPELGLDPELLLDPPVAPLAPEFAPPAPPRKAAVLPPVPPSAPVEEFDEQAPAHTVAMASAATTAERRTIREPP